MANRESEQSNQLGWSTESDAPLMKANRHNRGSVLMEFIIVFPIYLALFGGVFMTGEMALRAVALASAERVAAHDVQKNAGGWDYVKFDRVWASMVGHDGNSAERTDTPIWIRGDRGQASEFYADTKVEGPWSVRAAVKAHVDYTLHSRISAWLGYADSHLSEGTKKYTRKGVRSDNLFGDLFSSGTESIWSKYRAKRGDQVKEYNYLTHKRTRYDAMTWRDNRIYPSNIVDAKYANSRWYQQVYGEKYHYWEGAANSSGENHQRTNQKTAPQGRNSPANYKRYGQFVSWSE